MRRGRGDSRACRNLRRSNASRCTQTGEWMTKTGVWARRPDR